MFKFSKNEMHKIVQDAMNYKIDDEKNLCFRISKSTLDFYIYYTIMLIGFISYLYYVVLTEFDLHDGPTVIAASLFLFCGTLLSAYMIFKRYYLLPRTYIMYNNKVITYFNGLRIKLNVNKVVFHMKSFYVH